MSEEEKSESMGKCPICGEKYYGIKRHEGLRSDFYEHNLKVYRGSHVTFYETEGCFKSWGAKEDKDDAVDQ